MDLEHRQAGSVAVNELLCGNKEGCQDQCFLLFNAGLHLGQISLTLFPPKTEMNNYIIQK